MKKLLLLLLIIPIGSFMANAQSFELMKPDGTAFENDTISISTSNDSSTIEVPVYVKNISSKVKEVLVKVYIKNKVAESSASYCWGGSCFDILTTPSTTFTTIEASDTAKEFHSDYIPNKTAGSTEIMYTFYNNNNSDDSVSVTIYYDIIVTGINHLSEIKESVRSYPNPVQNTLNINYNIYDSKSAKIAIYDIVGKQIKKKEVYNSDNESQIDVSDLNSGMYIWTFEIEGSPIKSQKFIKR